jgi:thymidylate synthase (FAD)
MDKEIREVYEENCLMIQQPDHDKEDEKVKPQYFIGEQNLNIELRITPDFNQYDGLIEGISDMMAVMRNKESVSDAFALVDLAIQKGVNPTVLESLVFTFEMKNVSLATTHQLVRHRYQGYSQLSTRATDIYDLGYRVPKTIAENHELYEDFKRCIEVNRMFYLKAINAGVPYQDARYIIPQSLATKIWVTGNYRSWQDFYSQRSCLNVQWEINFIARKVKEIITEWHPMFGEGLKRPCDKAGKCLYQHNMFPPCDPGHADPDVEYIFPIDKRGY